MFSKFTGWTRYNIVSIVRVHAAADTETVGFSAVGVDEGQMGVVRFAVGAFSPSCSPQYSHPQNHSNLHRFFILGFFPFTGSLTVSLK